ncbi:nucleotide exchange factors-like protein [Laetiporus sulphureus 93-53]|uniref:Nucleotide exchange factors-like protein n=1 Tax=Laetiporus sulphureus 93-53 TaxID=1314785 RepID=A0A165B5K0_9APHY|nr:nucleotide exchange factors-like protein [Laetiporus sulphureus 93-53]KZT00287.1 nucleotide exchange factors-like protein [Laetiporus sulphureus 93-53]
MENLLRWSIEHSTGPNGGQPPPPRPRQDLDPGIIDMILGKPDSQLMKEALAVAVDETKDEDERIQALDDFEMLVEMIDNANNIEKLNMWEQLHALLTSPTTSEGIKIQTLWVIGTAVQNNPSAQTSYLAHSPMPVLLSFLDPSVSSGKLRSKAVYALSGLLKHNAAAVKQFEEAGGWKVLKACLEDSEIAVRRKTAFLLNTLIVPTLPPGPGPTHPPLPPSVSESTGPPSSGTSMALHASAAPSESDQQPVHPNSHAAMQSDPSSFATSAAALKALDEHGLLQALISAMASPTPHGPDGETEGDADFDEKVIRSLHTYVTSCNGKFSEEQKRDLRRHMKTEGGKAGSDSKLAEKWGLTVDELGHLKKAIE